MPPQSVQAQQRFWRAILGREPTHADVVDASDPPHRIIVSARPFRLLFQNAVLIQGVEMISAGLTVTIFQRIAGSDAQSRASSDQIASALVAPAKAGSRACPWHEQGAAVRSLAPGFPLSRE